MTDTNTWWPLPSPDALGNMLGADDVRDAVKETILTWSPYYLAVLSSRLADAGRIGNKSQNPNPLPCFGTWQNDPEHRSFGAGQLASFLVTVPATVGDPYLSNTRQWRAKWRAQVVLQVFGTTWEEAADLISWYEKVVRWCLLQHRDLGGLAAGLNWVGNQYTGKLHASTRTEAQVVCAYNVDVPDVTDGRGPLTVPTQFLPTPQDPTVDDVVVTVTAIPDAAPDPPQYPVEDD